MKILFKHLVKIYNAGAKPIREVHIWLPEEDATTYDYIVINDELYSVFSLEDGAVHCETLLGQVGVAHKEE